ncbi:hypothetical protein KC328_g13483 [Hortaea werneckii]|nr:hypothetical protein KC328_g13483 [Hortaea werneckii]
MFASLMVSRLRQAATEAGVSHTAHWQSPDDIAGPDLPLAKAAEKVLASMHAVLVDTEKHYNEYMSSLERRRKSVQLNEGTGAEASEEQETLKHLQLTRAAEVRVVRNARALREPPETGEFKAREVAVEGGDD